MKSSPSIWRLLSKCQIDSEDFVFFVDFLENMNFMVGKKSISECRRKLLTPVMINGST